MSKFKVGDEVKLISKYSQYVEDRTLSVWIKWFEIGAIYTVEEAMGNSYLPIRVRGFWLPEDIFELVEEELDDFLEVAQPNLEEVLEEKALRYNSGKLKWSLVHFASLVPLVQVLMMGAEKYAPDNWKKGFDRRELLDSAMRHMTALIDGEENDPESGLSHAGHIMCNMMFYCFHFVIKK